MGDALVNFPLMSSGMARGKSTIGPILFVIVNLRTSASSSMTRRNIGRITDSLLCVLLYRNVYSFPMARDNSPNHTKLTLRSRAHNEQG